MAFSQVLLLVWLWLKVVLILERSNVSKPSNVSRENQQFAINDYKCFSLFLSLRILNTLLAT